MPTPDRETSKDHYSMQEMMERLRAEGETKSRKRRSNQPHVEQRRKRRRWLILLAVAILLLCFAWIILQMMNKSRVEGELFRASVNRHLSGLLGCQVECDRFRSPDWQTAESSNMRFAGTSGVLKDVLFTDLKADLTAGSFFRNEWDIASLRVDSATVAFQSSTASKPLLDDANIGSTPTPVDDGFRLGLTATPAFVSIQDLRIAKLALSWPEANDAPNSIDGMIASGSLNASEFRIEASGGVWHGGVWHGGVWPDLPLEKATVTHTAGGTSIDNARFRLTEKTQLRAAGMITHSALGPSGSLDINVDATSISDLLPEVWKSRIHGKTTVQGAKYLIKPGRPNVFTGTLAMDGAVLENFPGLAALGAFFKNELYTKIELRKLTADFSHSRDVTTIENIDGFKHGESRLRGSVKIFRDGRLEGKLELHLHTPDATIPQFIRQEDGLGVVAFTLGGTVTNPTDSLSEQFPIVAPLTVDPSLIKEPSAEEK